MNPENLATAQEEATLTKIRNFLNEQKVKLWEEPYYDPVQKTPQEVRSPNENKIAVTLYF